MAITYTTNNLATNKFIPAFNNHILEFSDTAKTQDYADISFGGNTLRITPNNNAFYFNCRELFIHALETQGIYDTNAINFSYLTLGFNYWDKYNVKDDLDITITFTDATTSTDTISNLYVFYSATQIGSGIAGFSFSGVQLLCQSELTLFKGYPYEIPFFEAGGIAQSLYGINLYDERKAKVQTIWDFNRAYLSNGKDFIDTNNLGLQAFVSTTFTYSQNPFVIDNPCAVFDTETEEIFRIGYNNMLFHKQGDAEVLPMTIRYVDKCGVYLKYLNRYGAYQYWLFDRVYSKSLTHSITNAYMADAVDIEDDTTGMRITGKDSEETWSLQASNLTNSELEQVIDIFTSPLIYLYTAEKGSSAQISDFREVTIVSGTQPIKSTKRSIHKLNLEIRLDRYTI